MSQLSYHAVNGNGGNTTFSIDSFSEDEIKVYVDGVLKTTGSSNDYTIPNYTSTGGTVTWVGTPPSSSNKIRIVRTTDVMNNGNTAVEGRATYAAGSSVKAADLNNNQKQVLRALQEHNDQLIQTYDIEPDAITNALIADNQIDSEHYVDGSIDLVHMSANSVDSDQYVDGSIDRVHLEADIIDGTKIEDKAVDSEHLADNAVGTLAIGPNSVTMAKLGSGALPTDITVASANIEDNTIKNIDINSAAGILGTKINPDFGSQNIVTTGTVNGVSTTELSILDNATVTTAELNKLDGVTASTAEINKLAGLTSSTAELNILDGVTASGSEINKLDGVTATTSELNILDGVTASTSEINTLDGITSTAAELNILDGVTATTAEINKLDGVTASTSELNILDGVTATTTEINIIDGVTATTAELNLNDGQTATPTEVNILDGATLNTSELNKLDGVTASTSELNLLDGKTIVTSIASNATDTQLPSAQAVNERISALVTQIGGFVPIANETSFPTTNPDINNNDGTIVSIADVGGLKVADGSGSGTYAGTAGNSLGATTTAGTAVTITGIDTTLRGTTIAAGKGMLVETTATLNEYTYHRLVIDEDDITNIQNLVTNFNEKYYGALSSNPATRPSGANRQDGDLYFNSSDNKMKVYNGSHASGTWDDVAAPGSFFINTLSSSSESGGGSATFNGTATRFTLSHPPTSAQQLIVSVNGVIQKPNTGTSPSEGFATTGNDIIFASAPATNAPFFIVTLGSSVNIGTPSNNTVDTAQIVDGSINNSKISSSAAIAGTKISPDFGSQNVVTTGQIKIDGDGGSKYISVGDNEDLKIYHDASGPSIISDGGNQGLKISAKNLNFTEYSGVTTRFRINDDGHVDVTGNLDVGAGLDVTGNVAASGTIAANGGNMFVTGTSPAIFFTDTDHNDDFYIQNQNGVFRLVDNTDTKDRLVVDSDGHVGINDSTPSVTLDITGEGGGNGEVHVKRTSGASCFIQAQSAFAVFGSNTNHPVALKSNGTTALTIDTSQRVGIGTTSPSDNLEIASTVPTLRLTDTDGGPCYHQIKGPGNGDLRISCDVGDSSSSASEIQFDVHDSTKMVIQSTGNVGIGTTSPAEELVVRADAPSIQLESSNASGRNYGFQASNDGKFHAYDGTAGVNRLTLDSSGKVGIGTTSPVGLLHLHQADSGTVDGLMITNTSTTNNGLTVGVNSTEQPFFWNGSNTDMLFATDNTERMRINSTGKVGIGATDPQANLHLKVTGTDSPYQQFESANYNSFIGTAQSDDNLGTGSKAGNLVLRGQTGVAITGNNGTATQVKIDADGLKFGTDTAATNALDDYEEGTWTPAYNAGGAAGACFDSGISYNTGGQTGRYTKIGNVVYFRCNIDAASAGLTAKSGILQINGLPFTSVDETYVNSGAAFFMYTSAFGAGDANRPIPLVLENNAVIQFYNQNGSSYAGNALPGPQYPIQLAGMYHAA